MRKIALILCFSLIFGLFSGCSGEDAYVPTGNALEDAAIPTEEPLPGREPVQAQPFSLAYYPEDGFNPYLCEGFTNRQIFSLLYQGLFTVDGDYQVEPMLCGTFSVSEDMKTYTFHLEAATFSDGSVLTAQDVVTSLDTAKANPVYEGRFRNIESVGAVDHDTVAITTTTEMENLPLLLDIPIVKATSAWESIPLGTGPYQLQHADNGLVLQRRNDWWFQGAVPVALESIELWPAESPAQIRDWFEFDQVGVAYADPGAASYVDYRCDYEVWDCETGVMLYLVCNPKNAVFASAEVRTALSCAIDRSGILEECYNGFGIVSTLPASPNSPVYDKTLADTVGYEPQRLTQVLADKQLTDHSVRLLVNKSDSVRLRAARIIAQTLTDCGLKVEIDEQPGRIYQDMLYTGDFDLYLGQTQLSANMDVGEFYATYGNLRWGSLSNPDIYSLSQKALENSGNFYNLHQTILQDGQLCPILFRTYAVYMERGLLEDLSPARDNVFWYSSGRTMEQALEYQ